MEAVMLLEKFACGRTSYALYELESGETSRAVIVPLAQDGASLSGGVYAAEDGKRLADVQPGDSIIVLGLKERVTGVEIYRPQQV
jgi:hypothetical protein